MHRENFEIPEMEIPPPIEDRPKPSGPVRRRALPPFVEAPQFHSGGRGGVGYRLVAWSAVAALIDGLILFSVSCFLLLAFALILQVRVQTVLQLFQSSFFQNGIFAEFTLGFFYMVILRAFLGFTIGEWACGLRLGNLKQRLHRTYGLRVIARTLIIFGTGLFTLPVLSLLLGKDLSGSLVALPLIEHEEKK